MTIFIYNTKTASANKRKLFINLGLIILLKKVSILIAA